MRIGYITSLRGRAGEGAVAANWNSISDQANAAEAAGFDMFVFEDALMWQRQDITEGVWESVSIAAAVAATTSRINLGQSVVNTPYRSPAMMAKIADTIDEIAAGRFVLGLGAGNTPDSDYEAFGFPTDHRYSRFAEAIQIIHGLLKTGSVDFDGEYYTAKRAKLVLRGPRPGGPPILIAAKGPRMLRLVARYADLWNWWGWDETVDQLRIRLRPIFDSLERACETERRDIESLGRTFDLYTIVPPGFDATNVTAEGVRMKRPVTGTPEEIAAYLRGLGELGFEEVRCDVYPKTVAAIEAMGPIVEMLHAR